MITTVPARKPPQKRLLPEADLLSADDLEHARRQIV